MIKKDLSFILPALNEEAHIGGVLDSIRRVCDQRFLYEVIVVDNGSSDRTTEIAKKNNAICLHAPGYTISSLRNLGTLKASGDIFVFLDSDVYLKEDWGGRIMQVMECLHSQPGIITGSFCGISEKNNWIERIWFAPRAALKEINYINSGHMIIHRNLFTRIGGFDPKLETGEDYEFCARARRMGARIENDPELKVVHEGYPQSIGSFFHRERWHARGDSKSLKQLASSKPALVSLANLCIAMACAIGAFLCSQPWFIFPCAYLIFLTSISLAASIHRNRGNHNSYFFGVALLYMIYFTARTASLVEVISQSFTEKKHLSSLRKP